jgi:hypothetical protein
MEVGEFQVSLSADAPKAEIRLAQQALWRAGKGAWEQAHECIQQRERDPDCDLVHAYLHRLEGDLGNAALVVSARRAPGRHRFAQSRVGRACQANISASVSRFCYTAAQRVTFFRL